MKFIDSFLNSPSIWCGDKVYPNISDLISPHSAAPLSQGMRNAICPIRGHSIPSASAVMQRGQIDARNVVSSVAEQLRYLLAGLQLRVTLVEKVLLPLRRAGVAQTVKRHRPGEACPPSQSNVIYSSLSMAFGLGRGHARSARGRTHHKVLAERKKRTRPMVLSTDRVLDWIAGIQKNIVNTVYKPNSHGWIILI